MSAGRPAGPLGAARVGRSPQETCWGQESEPEPESERWIGEVGVGVGEMKAGVGEAGGSNKSRQALLLDSARVDPG